MKHYTKDNPPPTEMEGKCFWARYTDGWYREPWLFTGVWRDVWHELVGPIPGPEEADDDLAERVGKIEERIACGDAAVQEDVTSVLRRVESIENRINANENAIAGLRSEIEQGRKGHDVDEAKTKTAPEPAPPKLGPISGSGTITMQYIPLVGAVGATEPRAKADAEGKREYWVNRYPTSLGGAHNTEAEAREHADYTVVSMLRLRLVEEVPVA